MIPKVQKHTDPNLPPLSVEEMMSAPMLPNPRKRLRFEFAVPAGADPTTAALAAATFAVAVVSVDRKMKLTTNPALTGTADGTVRLVFDMIPLGFDFTPRVEKVLARANELAATCSPLALTSATVEAC